MEFSKILTRIFGSRNERLLKRYRRIVEQINEWEPKVSVLPDAALRARTAELHDGVASGKLKFTGIQPEVLAIIRESMDRHIGIRQIFNPESNFDPDQFDDGTLEMYDEVQRRMIATGESWERIEIPVEIFQAVRKLYPDSRPPFRARCFDVQLIGGLVLFEGKIAEMATGEGKTFVAPLACFLKVIEGQHCHVVTVNDYLVRRDASWVRPAFENLGVSVGYIQMDMEPGGDSRRRQYECDVTYGTNSEFGFDYLRDNMKERADLQVQGPLDFAIVDEVDSILIDEARTPLIISGGAHDDAPKYRAADAVARKVIELNKPWDQVEKAVEAAKKMIKSAEGDMDKAATREEKEAARLRHGEGETKLAEAEKRKEGLTQYFEVEYDRKQVHLTHEGVAAAQEAAGVGSFYVGNNMEWPHLMEQSLRAHVVYEKDKDYVVERGPSGQLEVVIVDEYTGRKLPGRQWSDGLHQAGEAKERVPIKQETQTLATITLQNFFKLYKSLAGMTGTAMTEAEEFVKIYNLDVVTMPTNRPMIRQDTEDRVYRTAREKWDSILEEIKLFSDSGRPILVGTTSVEKSEMLAERLKRKYGIEHEVLNAKQHEREALIIAKAGQHHLSQHGEKVGNVTIATNMAGRGTDIKPAPETFFDVIAVDDYDKSRGFPVTDEKIEALVPEEPSKGSRFYTLKQRVSGRTFYIHEQHPLALAYQLKPSAKVVGGLHVIGTERHTARRIDNQLRGRSGRQGDPGSSRFYVSLEDELMKLFAGEWTIKVLGWLGMEEGMAIEDKRISKGILRAQKKVEERNFLARKNLLEYDEVMEHQRKVFYGMRQKVLLGKGIDEIIWDMISDAIGDAVDKYITEDYVAATIAEWARVNFDVNIDANDIRGIRNYNELEDYLKDQARAEAVTSLTATLGEFTGEDTDDRIAWDTKGLQSWLQSRFHVHLSQNQLRSMDVDELEQKLRDSAIEQINKRDCAGITKFLAPHYAENELANWAKEKFNVDTKAEDFIADERPGRKTMKNSDDIVAYIEEKARESYSRREIEYPVEHTLMYSFGGEDGSTDNPYAADFVRAWVKERYGEEMSLEHIRSLSVRKLRDEIVGYQSEWMNIDRIGATVDRLIQENPTPDALLRAVNQRFGVKLMAEDLNGSPAADSNGDAAESTRDRLIHVGRNFFRRELTQLEQFVLIQILDTSWKDHLYAMDLLKSGIGLQAFAERDPRVMYKKEGYRYFQEMMAGVRDKVTDLIFRARLSGAVEQKSAYNVTAATHQDVGGYGVAENLREIGAPESQQAQASSGGEAASGEAAAAIKTIVRDKPKVGRNDDCPCGSGKKYKKCCGRDAA